MRDNAIWKSTKRLGAIAAALCSVAALPSSARTTSVPFAASFSGSAWFTSETTVTFDGVGTATYLGSSSNDGTIVIVGPPDAEGCLPNINTEVLVAANGDELQIEMVDIACPVAPPLPIFHGTGNWTVIGGTGRFAGVSGSGTVDGNGNFVTGTFAFTLTGSLLGLGSD